MSAPSTLLMDKSITDHYFRTMVWAIDLDDGTLIDALGENLGRDKARTYKPFPAAVPDFGTGG